MIPSFVILAFVISSLYGLVFYLILGHGWLRLLMYWFVSVVGFFLGQWLASVIGVSIFNIGELNLVEGTLASGLCLWAAHAWRHQVPPESLS